MTSAAPSGWPSQPHRQRHTKRRNWQFSQFIFCAHYPLNRTHGKRQTIYSISVPYKLMPLNAKTEIPEVLRTCSFLRRQFRNLDQVLSGHGLLTAAQYTDQAASTIGVKLSSVHRNIHYCLGEILVESVCEILHNLWYLQQEKLFSSDVLFMIFISYSGRINSSIAKHKYTKKHNYNAIVT